MENPLISSDAPAAPEVPKEAAAKPVAPKAKKKFFTTGKIIAIFGALIVIAAIVGAIIYSQTSERFQGALTNVKAPASAPVVSDAILTNRDITKAAVTCADADGLTLNDAGTSCVCDVSENFVPTIEPLTPTTYVAPCLCKEGTLFNSDNNTCEEVNYCDLTKEEMQSAINDSFNINTRTELEAILADYSNWRADNCGLGDIGINKQPLTNVTITEKFTCNDYINDFKAAYANRNWEAYKQALGSMVENDCITLCEEKIYWEIFYLWTGNLDQAKIISAEYKKGCTDCNAQFDFIVLVAQVVSDIDQAEQEVGKILNPAYTEFLKTLVTNYINQCQCIEIEAFLDNPTFNVIDTFPESTTSDNSASRTSSFTQLTYTENDVLVVAYAQSSSLSPAVTTVLEDAVQQLCEEEEIPVNCSLLEITLPSSDDMEITEDFVAANPNHNLEFTVTGTDNVENYHITASNDTLIFDGQDDNIYSDDDSVTLSGGPVANDPVTITVQAVDVTGLPLNECVDSITISRTPPTDSAPVCSLLEITLPSSDDMEITEDFVAANPNHNLEFTVTGTDNVENYHITASNDTLIFDGQDDNIYSDDDSVTLSGGPVANDPVTITVQAVDVTGLPLNECVDSITISRTPPTDSAPVCRSLNIVSPVEANQSGSPEFMIPAGGFIDQPLTVEIDGDQGSWANLTYTTALGNQDIVFDGTNPTTTDALTVLMNGKPEFSDRETIRVSALHPETQQLLDECSDSFTVILDTDTPPSLTYTPPEEEDEPPSLSYTPPEEDDPPTLTYTPPEEEDDPPSLAYTPPEEEDPPTPSTYTPPAPIYTPTPEEPAPIYTAPGEPAAPIYVAPAPLHAAPATPQTGPGMIIPLIGVALGGAWMRRKRK